MKAQPKAERASAEIPPQHPADTNEQDRHPDRCADRQQLPDAVPVVERCPQALFDAAHICRRSGLCVVHISRLHGALESPGTGLSGA